MAFITADKVVRSAYPSNDLDVRNESIIKSLWTSISSPVNSLKTALIEVETGCTVTYGQLYHEAELTALRLYGNGCRRNDLIAVFAPNSIQWIVWTLAVLRIGAIPVLMSSKLTVGELERQLKISNAKFICFAEKLSAVAIGAAEACDLQGIFTYNTKTDRDGATLSKQTIDGSKLPPIDVLNWRLDDAAMVLFSSGTTGLQKALLVSHRYLQFHLACARHPAIQLMTNIAFAPMPHLAGLIPGFFPLAFGLTIYIMDQFDIRQYMHLLHQNKESKALLVPPVAVMMVKNADTANYSLDHLTDILIGAAPVSSELEDLLMKRFKGLQQIRQVYGMTEVGVCCGNLLTDVKHKPGSVGVPFPGVEMKVINTESGENLSPNVVGEICFRLPSAMLCYMNNEKETKSTIKADGWVHSGDLGYYDEDGKLFVIDRLKELIKYKANQVAPAEIEAVLLSHEQVADAAVLGLPDDVAGELPMAWVVKKPSALITEKQLQDYVKERVAPYKRLRGGIRFVSAIPKSASGKILRRVMKAEVIKENARL